jgi:hypothetical protein
VLLLKDLMPDSELHKQWLDGHRMGQAAALCLSGDPALLADGTLFRAEELVAESLQRMQSLRGLPLVTLSNLSRWASLEVGDSRRAPDGVAKRSIELAECIRTLTTPDRKTGGQCAIGMAQCAASVVLRSNWGPESLRRLFISRAAGWYGYGRDEWRGVDERFGPQMGVLRSPWRGGPNTESRLCAAIELSESLRLTFKNKLYWNGRRFAFELMDRLFAWPLLVLQSEGASWAEFGTSLPLKVDLKRIDGPSVLRLMTSADDPVIDHQPWRASTGRVLAEALRQFEAAGGQRRAVAYGLHIEVDFCWADRLMQPLCRGLLLAGRSFEAYLAMVVLSRLLNVPASPATLITGEIDGSEGTPRLAWPGGTEHKIRHVFDSALADRVIVPTGFADRVESLLSSERRRQTASILQVDRLSTAMVAALGPVCAEPKAVRCPEVTRRQDLPLVANARADSIDAVLSRNQDLCVDFSQHPQTTDVCADDLAFTFRRRFAGSPPSTLFVRVHTDEDDDAVWELIGESLAWSESDIDSLLRAGSPVQLAERVIELLDPGKAFVSPAYIVVAGGSDVAEEYRRAVDPTLRPHCLVAVLESLRDKVASSRTALTCRFLLIPSAMRRRKLPEGPLMPPWLERLRVFRGSFDLRCAASVLKDLNAEPGALRKGLDDAVAAGWLLRLPDGDYFLDAYDADTPATTDPAQALADEQSAAEALVGPAFAPGLRRSGLCLDESFRVSSVLEACYHLGQAIVAAGNAGDANGHIANRLQGQLFFAHRYLRRRSLSSLTNRELLWRAPELVMEWVRDDAERMKQAGCVVHPLFYAWEGRVAFNYLWRSQDFSQLESRVDELFKMYRQGLVAINSIDEPNRREIIRHSVGSRLDVLINRIEEERLPRAVLAGAKHASGPAERAALERFATRVGNFIEDIKARDLVREARDAAMRWPDPYIRFAFTPDWIERVGSEAMHAIHASRVLLAGVRNWPTWIHFFPWLFGAIEQAKCEPDADHAALAKMEREAVHAFASAHGLHVNLRERLNKPVVDHHLDSPFAPLAGVYRSNRWSSGNAYIDTNLSSNRKLKLTLLRLGT